MLDLDLKKMEHNAATFADSGKVEMCWEIRGFIDGVQACHPELPGGGYNDDYRRGYEVGQTIFVANHEG